MDAILPVLADVAVTATCLQGICSASAFITGTSLARDTLMPLTRRREMPPGSYYKKQMASNRIVYNQYINCHTFAKIQNVFLSKFRITFVDASEPGKQF